MSEVRPAGEGRRRRRRNDVSAQARDQGQQPHAYAGPEQPGTRGPVTGLDRQPRRIQESATITRDAQGVSSEIKLRAEFEKAPAHNFVWGQPLRAVPGVLRQDSAPVEHVVNVEIAFEREIFNPKTL